MRLVVSFADPMQGHNGGIYQAMNWIHDGTSGAEYEFFYNGKWQHRRQITGRAFGASGKVENYQALPKRLTKPKYRYLMPLDAEMRKQIEPLRKPYPKRATSIDSDAPEVHSGEGGASPTVALFDSEEDGTTDQI